MAEDWRAQGAPSDGYGLLAFFAARARFHLVYRLTVRFFQLVSVDGGGHVGRWRFVVLAFAGLDLVIWLFVRRPERFGLRTRLLLDAGDIAVWTLAPYPPEVAPVLAILIGFPLALEAGLRRGVGGLVVPGTLLVSTGAVCAVASRPFSPSSFLWPVMGVGAGVLLRRYLARLEFESEREWTERCEAEAHRGFLAGQNAVAMGASSIVDVLESVVPVLGQPTKGSALEQLHDAWKTSLYQSTTGHAAYLGQVLMVWSAEHNRHPDLASRVELHLAEGVGTTLLTGPQAAVLRQGLSDLDLRGALPVALADPTASQRLPGGRLQLAIGPHVLELPADRRRPPQSCDPGPAAFVLAALLIVGDLLSYPIGPFHATVGVVVSTSAAWWAHRLLQRRGRAAWPIIVIGAMGVALGYTALATLGLGRSRNAAGLANYPVVVGLDLLALVTGMYWDNLRRSVRWCTAATCALVVVISFLLNVEARDPVRAATQVLWALPVLLGAIRLQRELAIGGALQDRKVSEEMARSVAEAYAQGVDTVVGLVRKACVEAHERLGAIRPMLSPDLALVVSVRLEEIDRRLMTLVIPSDELS